MRITGKPSTVSGNMKPDYIVVGGGSAGCVVAGELARAGCSVWLFEAGANQRSLSPAIHRPADYLKSFGSKCDWNFLTEKQSALNHRSLRWPRGRGLGGSSLINAMIFYPPLASDWSAWEAACGPAWSAARMNICMLQLEAKCRGWVEPLRYTSPATRAAIEAAEDYWGPNSLNVHRVMCRHGQRVTLRDLWQLDELQHRGKLRIIANTTACKVLLDQQKAYGIQTGDGEEVHATKGVVLCAGSLGSPQLLFASGIGDRGMLRAADQACYVEAEEVGANLQDHLVVPLIAELDSRYRFPSNWTARDIRQWKWMGRGPIVSNLAEASGLLPQLRVEQVRPECLWFTTPTHYLLHPQPRAPAAMTLAIVGCHPASRGRVRWRSTESGNRLVIDPGYLTIDSDVDVLWRGIQQVRPLWEHPRMRPLGVREVLPGGEKTDESSIKRYVARFAQTLYHPVGTCRMGSDSKSVTDPAGGVRHVEKLWVVDASVFPQIPAVNPHAMVLAVALRLAHELLRQSN